LTLEIFLILNCNDMFLFPLVTDPKEEWRIHAWENHN